MEMRDCNNGRVEVGRFYFVVKPRGCGIVRVREYDEGLLPVTKVMVSTPLAGIGSTGQSVVLSRHDLVVPAYTDGVAWFGLWGTCRMELYREHDGNKYAGTHLLTLVEQVLTQLSHVSH